MKQLLTNLFGIYTPVTDQSGNVVSGMAGVDWPYVLGVCIFIVFLYCCLRIVGGLLTND